MANEIDALFALPLAEFTAARNELAKRLAKDGDNDTAAEVRKLAKPTLPAGAQSAAGREALRSGRLSTELEPAGFEALAGLAAPAPRGRDELAEARRAKQERLQERRRLQTGLRELERKADAAEREAER